MWSSSRGWRAGGRRLWPLLLALLQFYDGKARRAWRPLQRCERFQKRWLQPAEMIMASKAELTRLWTWTGNLIEELSALQDAIAKLAEEDED